MPSPVASSLIQKAVLWSSNGVDSYGKYKHSAPVELNPSTYNGVKWLKGRQDTFDAQGNTIKLNAAALVASEIDIGSVLWLATDQTPGSDNALDQWNDSGSTGNDDELQQVISYHEYYDVKGRVAVRMVGLARYMDQITVG